MKLFFMQESAQPETNKTVDLLAISEGIGADLINIVENEAAISGMMYESLSEEVNLMVNEADEEAAETTRWAKVKEFFKNMINFFIGIGRKIATFIRETFEKVAQRFINAEKFVKENEALIRGAKGTYPVKDFKAERKIIEGYRKSYVRISAARKLANDEAQVNLIKSNLAEMKAKVQNVAGKEVAMRATEAMKVVQGGKTAIKALKEEYAATIKALKEAQDEAKAGVKAVDKKDKAEVAAKRKVVKNMNTIIGAARTCNNLLVKSYNEELTAATKVIREIAFVEKKSEKVLKGFEKKVDKVSKKKDRLDKQVNKAFDKAASRI